MFHTLRYSLALLLFFAFPLRGEVPPSQEKKTIQTAPTQWKHWLKKGHVGDFIVTEQDNTYSLLWIHALSEELLSLEEITIPQNLIDLKTVNWQKWVKENAKGHTSWTRYQIDLHDNQLLYAFSFSKKGWLRLDESQQFLTRLLSLSLSKIPQEKQRKIGPPPPSSGEDRRALWVPPLILHGKKISSPSFEVWGATWPRDKTPISECRLEIYFSSGEFVSPFPYWIEIKSPHYAAKIRTVDSGHNMASPFSLAL